VQTNWGDVGAVYAAVVATGALGWQVYQSWLRRAGRLVVARVVGHAYRARADTVRVEGTIYNSNDYPVKLDHLEMKVWTRVQARSFDVRLSTWLPPAAAGLPTEIAPRDSVKFQAQDNFPSLRDGGYVPVTVWNNLRHRSKSPRVSVSIH
jgi:hypothetical protein